MVVLLTPMAKNILALMVYLRVLLRCRKYSVVSVGQSSSITKVNKNAKFKITNMEHFLGWEMPNRLTRMSVIKKRMAEYYNIDNIVMSVVFTFFSFLLSFLFSDICHLFI